MLCGPQCSEQRPVSSAAFVAAALNCLNFPTGPKGSACRVALISLSPSS